VTGPAFKIGEDLFPYPTRFRLGDGVLVKELTGLEWDEFAARFDAVREDPKTARDYLVMVGLVGVAVWQANPRWTMPKVIAFVNDVDMEAFDSVGGDDAGPPVVAEEEQVSPTLSVEPTTSPELSAEPAPV
jgi:hypothetical protein